MWCKPYTMNSSDHAQWLCCNSRHPDFAHSLGRKRSHCRSTGSFCAFMRQRQSHIQRNLIIEILRS